MRIVALPRDPNPYQERLYGELARRGTQVRYAGDLTPSQTLNLLLLPLELLAARLRGWDVLHLHWVYGFRFPWSDGEAPRRVAQAWFGVVLRVARALRMEIVWTAHNVLPHERVFHDDVAARRRLVRAADLVLAHGPATLERLRALGAEPRRSAIVPLGPYAAQDVGDLAPPASRPGPRRLLFFGKVLAYKGVEDLLAVLPEVDGLHVRVVGACPDPALRARLEALAARAGDRVELRLEHVPAEEIRALHEDADAVVLPFRDVTTSSSALLAMEHGRPVVLPDLPAFAELPGAALFHYPPGELRGALERVAAAPADELRGRGTAARAYAGGTSWADAAERTERALREVAA